MCYMASEGSLERKTLKQVTESASRGAGNSRQEEPHEQRHGVKKQLGASGELQAFLGHWSRDGRRSKCHHVEVLGAPRSS